MAVGQTKSQLKKAQRLMLTPNIWEFVHHHLANGRSSTPFSPKKNLGSGDRGTLDQRMFHPQYDQIQVATLNVRRFLTRYRLTELQEALRRTYVYILAVTELCWRGIGCMY
ncbi:hypothetical protein Y032_0053g2403 [Ancylostoma ceylanicum]|uniref:Uncharacterized protein n=1 Tax=Ancylostoma ceylanicum TaxID=53326 RepID=A0A016U8Q3_9BILA|nr:hypothetical protein Y032_0053g2403 [Ancylostoma ceylanicum]